MGPYPVSSKKLTRTTEWDGAKDLLFTVFAYFILPSPFESNAAELSSSTSFISFQKGHMKASFSVRSRPRSVTDDCTDLRVPRLVPEPGRSVRWIVARIRLFFKMRIPLGFPSATQCLKRRRWQRHAARPQKPSIGKVLRSLISTW